MRSVKKTRSNAIPIVVKFTQSENVGWAQRQNGQVVRITDSKLQGFWFESRSNLDN